MWKREKIGSTIRIGPDNVMPFIKIQKESINKVISTLMKEHLKSNSIIEFQPFGWLIDRFFKFGTDNETIHWFSSKDVESEYCKSKSSFNISSLKMDIIASRKEFNHLPSKWFKKMLNSLWKNLKIENMENDLKEINLK